MQRAGFRFTGQNGIITDDTGPQSDESFGILASGRAHVLAADTALTGTSVNMHRFSAKAGATYEIRATGWVNVATIGTLFAGINPFAPSAGVVKVAQTVRTAAAGTVVGGIASGTGFQTSSIAVASTGLTWCQMVGEFLADIDVTVGVTYAVTGGGVMTLIAGSWATASRIQ